MTLVIGAKYKGGVILVADRKVTNPNSHKPEWVTKLKQPYANSAICFGATGYKSKYDQFNRKILQIVGEHMRETELMNRGLYKKNNLEYPETEQEEEVDKTLDMADVENKPEKKESKKQEILQVHDYTMENFLEDSQDLIRRLCTEPNGLIRSDLEALVILYNNDETRLHHLDFDGSEEELDYYAIGSGANYVNLFLSKFWHSEITIDQILKLAYFCIYYVQDLKFDNGVGVEEGILPDHFGIADGGNFGYYKGFRGKEIEIINEVRNQVNKFEDVIANLPF